MTLLLKIDPGKPDAEQLAQAVRVLCEGGVVAFPTETFYGLGADARNETAVEKIFRIKGRNFRNPLSVIVANDREVIPLVEEIPAAAQILMKTFWPGPLTLIFRASSSVLPRLTADTGKIGIRVSSHPLARLLAGGLGGPLTATSANLSGGPECSSVDAVMRALGELPDSVIDGGETPGGAGSTILDVTVFPPRILRAGAISGDLILNALPPTEG
ncbi:MAG: L-threonylcarbamoyladenylate synthase [Deltaproteobacteria bacterium]|nr:L-threonylcarbamoyladenylate synthase [Deltaproteobacteria bacterium]